MKWIWTGDNIVPCCCYCFAWLPFALSKSSDSISPDDKHNTNYKSHALFMVNEWAVKTLTSCTCATSSVNILTRFCFLSLQSSTKVDHLLCIASGVDLVLYFKIAAKTNKGVIIFICKLSLCVKTWFLNPRSGFKGLSWVVGNYLFVFEQPMSFLSNLKCIAYNTILWYKLWCKWH